MTNVRPVGDLLIGDRSYSSWSLRGWLIFDAFGLPVKTRSVRLYTPAFQQALADYPPARTVPVLRLASGTVVPETTAITEELASRHPEAGLWPEDPDHRAVARRLVAEMHAGFVALRSWCPMNLRVSYTDCEPSEEVLADLARIEHLWRLARQETGAEGPWLCGAYSAADAFFAPVAARIAGYNLPVGPEAAAYVAAHLAHPSFRRWRAQGLTEPPQAVYDKPYPQRPWPGPAPRPARAIAEGQPENARCPYSGGEASYLMEMEQRVFGFCNPTCRDKTVADPEAWPAFMALV